MQRFEVSSRSIARTLAAAAALASLAALAACGNASSQDQAHATPASPRAESRPALTVSTTRISSRPVVETVVGTGSIAAWQQLTIAAEIAGLRIVEVAVDEGDAVRQGQVLARFDSSILEAQLAQYESAVAEAQANLVNAQAEFARAQELQNGRNIAEAVFQQRQMAARAVEARLGIIRAQRDEVKARIAQSVIRAPTDGIVSKRSALLGSVGSIGAELFRIVRDGRVELQAQIPELGLTKVRAGQTATVTHGGRTVTAVVRLVAPVVDAATRLGTAYVTLPPDSGFSPGMFARADITVAAGDALAVPQEALVFRDGRPAAFAVDPEGRVSLRIVETGVRRAGWVEVRRGLSRDERIVVAGAGFLNDGDLVRVDTAEASAGDARR